MADARCKNLYRFIRLRLGESVSDREIARRWSMDWTSFSKLKHGTRKVPRIEALEELSTILLLDASLVFEVARGVDANLVHELIERNDESELSQLLMAGVRGTYRQMQAQDRSFRVILDRLNDAVFVLDIRGHFREVNERLGQLLGLRKQAVLSRTIFDCVTAEDVPRLMQALAELYSTGEMPTSEFSFVRKQQPPLVLELSVTRLDGPTGEAIGAQGVARDVTERREARRNANLLAAIVHSSSEAIFTCGVDGMFESWNEAAEKLFGYTREEILRTHISRLCPEELQKEQRDTVQRILQGEDVPPRETIRKRKDGQHIEILLTTSPMLDENGKAVGVSGIARDIRERKRTERDLARSRAETRAVLEAIPDMIFVLDPQGRYCEYIPARGLDPLHSPQEFLGRPLAAMLPGRVGAECQRLVDRAKETGIPQRLVYELPMGEQMRTWECRLIARADDHTVALVRDITDIPSMRTPSEPPLRN